MIIAEPHCSASQASPKAAINAMAVGVPGSSMRLAQRNSDGNDQPADQEGTQQEAERARGRLDDAVTGDVASFGQSGDNRQDQEAEDVVDHGGAQDDLPFRVAQPAQVGEHPGRDPDAGGRQRRRRP